MFATPKVESDGAMSYDSYFETTDDYVSGPEYFDGLGEQDTIKRYSYTLCPRRTWSFVDPWRRLR